MPKKKKPGIGNARTRNAMMRSVIRLNELERLGKTVAAAAQGLVTEIAATNRDLAAVRNETKPPGHVSKPRKATAAPSPLAAAPIAASSTPSVG